MHNTTVSIRQLTEDLLPQTQHMLLEGAADRDVLAYLRGEGCPPTVARNILGKAHAALRARNRTKGFIILGVGLAIVLIALWLGEGLTSDELHLHGRTGRRAVLMAVFGPWVGGLVMLVGGWYALFGRTIQAVEERY